MKNRIVVSGVYMIKNTMNGKIYIGSSNNIHKRWGEHRYSLKGNKHINCYLQNSWNKNGENNFVFSILEESVNKKECLINTEQKYIDLYDSSNRKKGYNINPIAEIGYSLGCYKTWINKYGTEKADEMWKEVTKKNSAANSMENNAMWKSNRPEVGDLNKLLKSKSVLQYSLNGKFIQEFPSVTKASEILNINRRTIANFITQKDCFAAGFIWKYKN